ncbi:MAG: ribulose-phosphate 3-epimerase [Candidatus Omnitrophota bacterium]|nr:ribulose-phosphate 3-epimerase [Candidatus Omnitrophota bacterium]
MKRVVPALLTDNKDAFIDMLDKCAKFTDYVQIDIMDGEFVPSRSITIADLDGLKSPVGSEAHLMVNNPLAWVDVFKNLGAKKIIFHFESNNGVGKYGLPYTTENLNNYPQREFSCNHIAIIDEIKSGGLEVGIAINPSTRLDEFKFLVDAVDSVLFMAVNPGFYGAPFIPEVLDNIKSFKGMFPQKMIGIDGGVKLSNVKDILASGLDYICVGSAILKDADPALAYQKFIKIVNE